MRTLTHSIETIIFTEEDFKELGLKLGNSLGQYDTLELGFQRYVCLPILNKNKKEYQVLFSYFEDHADPDKLRENGGL